MRRVTRKTMANAIHLAPLIAEWRGTRTPALVFGGRRGQLMTLDLFDNDLGNYNFAIIGAPGSGKSVLMNEMAWSYRAIDAKVWMLDLGRSFEKLCRKAKGTYIEFKPDVDICLNPFTHIVRTSTKTSTCSCRASPRWPRCSGTLDEVQYKAISAMVLKLWREHGKDLTITGAARRLQDRHDRGAGRRNDQRIKDLAIMLNPYAKGGQYERFFEGRQRRLLERLHRHRERGTQAPARPARGGQHPAAAPDHRRDVPDAQPAQGALHRRTEAAARRHRRRRSGQGRRGRGGGAPRTQVRRRARHRDAERRRLLRLGPDGGGLQLLRLGVPAAPEARVDRDAGPQGPAVDGRAEEAAAELAAHRAGVFSELYISSPVGEGVARNILDPATHLLFSNKLEDNAPIDELRAQGLSIDEAIAELLRQRGHAVVSPGLKSLHAQRCHDLRRSCWRTLAAYDRVVVRPAQLIGVVDVAEVYRQKEAEFTLILTARRERRRARAGDAHGAQLCAAPAAGAGRTAARLRLPGGAEDRRRGARTTDRGLDGASAPQGGSAMTNRIDRLGNTARDFGAHLRQRWYLYLPVFAIWGFAYTRLFIDPTPRLPVLFNWTPSLPCRVALLQYGPQRAQARRLRGLRLRRRWRRRGTRVCAASPSSRSCAACPATASPSKGAWSRSTARSSAIAKTHTHDRQALEPIPAAVIPAGHYYVQGTSPDSFDSRYRASGLVRADQVLGTVIPLF
jgi:hypothetical protein